MQVKIKQISGLQDIIDTPVAMGLEYSQSFNVSVASTGNEFQTDLTMDFRPFADSVIQVQVNGLTVEGSYTDKLGGFYFSNDGITVKSMSDLESGDFLYWNGLIKGYQLEVGDIITVLYEREYLSYGTSGVVGSGTGTDGTSGTSGISAIWNFMETYNGNAEYHLGDVVTYEGQTWYALVSNQYMPPDMINRPNDWKLIAEKGTSGIDGTNGYAGTSGFTGTDGSAGTSGVSGTNGSAGTSGLQGPAGETLSVSGVVEDYNTLITTYGSIIGEFQPVLLTTVILKSTSELYIYDNVSGSADLNGWVNMGEIQGPQGISGDNGTSGTSGITGTNGSAGTSGFTGTSGTSGFTGTSGTNGYAGTSGTRGTSGSSGSTGTSGTSPAIPVSYTPNYVQTTPTSFSTTGSPTTFTVTSTSFTTTGKPIRITITGDANPLTGSGQWCRLQIQRNGVTIGNSVQVEATSVNQNQCYSLQFIDTPAAGTYTYSLYVSSSGGNWQFGEVNGPTINILEIGTTSSGNLSVVSPTTSYNILATDSTILCNPAAIGMTVTLPTAIGVTGKVYWIKSITTLNRPVIINTTSSQKIDGLTTLTLNFMGSTSNGGSGTSYGLISNGIQWYIITQH